MKIREMQRGMEIFAKYAGDEYQLGGAEHDKVHAVALDDIEDMTPEDAAELDELGWFKGKYGWEHYA